MKPLKLKINLFRFLAISFLLLTLTKAWAGDEKRTSEITRFLFSYSEADTYESVLFSFEEDPIPLKDKISNIWTLTWGTENMDTQANLACQKQNPNYISVKYRVRFFSSGNDNEPWSSELIGVFCGRKN